jgi:hypothetical protein
MPARKRTMSSASRWMQPPRCWLTIARVQQGALYWDTVDYLQPGAVILGDQQNGGAELHTLEIRTPTGQPAIVLLSQDFGELDLTIQLLGAQADRYRSWTVTRFGRGHLGEPLGRQQFQDGAAHLILPPRSITTLFPSGTAPLPDT